MKVYVITNNNHRTDKKGYIEYVDGVFQSQKRAIAHMTELENKFIQEYMSSNNCSYDNAKKILYQTPIICDERELIEEKPIKNDNNIRTKEEIEKCLDYWVGELHRVLLDIKETDKITIKISKRHNLFCKNIVNVQSKIKTGKIKKILDK